MAVIANAARDHEMAVEWTISAGVPTLVEKPFTLSAAASQRLIGLALGRNVRLAAAHVFLFAGYLQRFAALVSEIGDVTSLRLEWADPSYEHRYGEQKQYDPTLPVVADLLPHIVSIVSTVMPGYPVECRKLTFLGGGARVELDLAAGDVVCGVQLTRNSNTRRRIIEVVAGREKLQLDFSREPGIITRGAGTINGDPDWNTRRRPVAQMLTTFLRWGLHGERDNRLDPGIGLQANQVIDQALAKYHSAQISWLRVKLASAGQLLDDELRYALIELLQIKGQITMPGMQRQLDNVRRILTGKDGARLMHGLTGAQEWETVLSRIAMCRDSSAR